MLCRHVRNLTRLGSSKETEAEPESETDSDEDDDDEDEHLWEDQGHVERVDPPSEVDLEPEDRQSVSRSNNR